MRSRAGLVISRSVLVEVAAAWLLAAISRSRRAWFRVILLSTGSWSSPGSCACASGTGAVGDGLGADGELGGVGGQGRRQLRIGDEESEEGGERRVQRAGSASVRLEWVRLAESLRRQDPVPGHVAEAGGAVPAARSRDLPSSAVNRLGAADVCRRPQPVVGPESRCPKPGVRGCIRSAATDLR